MIHGERIHSDANIPSNTDNSHQISDSLNDYAQRTTRQAMGTNNQDPVVTTNRRDGSQEGVKESYNSVDTLSNINPSDQLWQKNPPLKDNGNVPALVSIGSSISKRATGDGPDNKNSNDGDVSNDSGTVDNAEVNITNNVTNAPIDENPKTDNQKNKPLDNTTTPGDDPTPNSITPFNESATPPVNSTAPPVEDDSPSANTGEPSTRPSSCTEDSINPTAPPDESEETIAAISIFFILVLLGT